MEAKSNVDALRRISRMFFNRRAVSNAVSATILTGAVIALSLAVLAWSESRSADYNEEFSQTVDAETAKLKEKLVFEYVSCDNPSHSIMVYLFNCGSIDNVEVKSVFVANDTWLQTYSAPILYSLDSTEVPDQDLDVNEECYFILSPSTSLSSGYYNIRVVTARGATFDAKLVV
ncbi:MAG: hypothetical protein JSW53_04610 [Candidatus Bathyarchaeota archaeon]|nr:MAG: hypothetical protein JSW53_04610 [Candidatus Bathyarchaeota archaeon]